MAKSNATLAVFSTAFVSAVQSSLNEYLEANDVGDNCVNAFSLAHEKQFNGAREADGSPMHKERLRLLIMSAVSTGQVPGVGIRKGRNGGVYRTKPASIRKPTAKTGKAANTTNTPSTTSKAAEAKSA